MFSTVPGVLAAPPALGLVASAVRPQDPDTRWTAGMAWIPERCGITYQLIPYCSDADPDTHDADTTGAVYYRPPAVRFAVACTTMGGGVDSERMLRVVDAATPYVIARELWSGTAAQAEANYATPFGGTGTNPYLASGAASVVGSGAASPAVALGLLEQAALDAGMGQRVMLHVPPDVLPLFGLGQIRMVGNDLLTMNGSYVIADAGYPGSGPAGQDPGATVWAYATSLVSVRMTGIEIEDVPAQTVDRATNTMTVWANRVIAATFDPCVHFATEITRE
jgi:hypothetical protein